MQRLTRVQLAGVGSLLLLCAGVTVHALLRAADVPFIFQVGRAKWIEYPSPTTTVALDAGPGPATWFEKRFTVADASGPVSLEIQALRDLQLTLNGSPLEMPRSRGAWKRPRRLRIESGFRPGEHRLRVRVDNPRGPALLRLRIEGQELTVVSDATWSARRAGSPLRPARVADDTRLNPDARGSPSPLRSLRSRPGLFLLLFAAGGLAALALARLPDGLVGRLPSIVLALLTLAWFLFFTLKLVPMRAAAGFDATGHLEYIRYLLTHHRLPLADAGWSTYHPPLFYLASALVARVGDAMHRPERLWLLRIIPCAAGLANVWAVYFVSRVVFPRQPIPAAFAVAVAGTLPMNIYMSGYISNESLHAALVALALIPGCRMLARPGVARGDIGLCGVLLGLAILTKATSVIVAPLVVLFVVAKLLLVDRATVGRAAAAAGGLAGSAALIGGWQYARNWLYLGRPLVGNWEQDWWQQPGFHTPAYYFGFGEVFRRPFFAGFHSFGDSIYSTLWGDGYVAGRALFEHRHAMWNYEVMSVVYLLAIPVTLVALLGVIEAIRRAFTERDPGIRAVLSLFTALICVIGFCVLYLTLRLPYYAQAKAFYGLCLCVPFSVTTALGLTTLHRLTRGRGRLPLRMLLYGCLGLFVGGVGIAFLG